MTDISQISFNFFIIITCVILFYICVRQHLQIDSLLERVTKLEGDIEDVDVYTYYPKYGHMQQKTKQNKVLDLLLAEQGLRLEKVYQVEDVKLIER